MGQRVADRDLQGGDAEPDPLLDAEPLGSVSAVASTRVTQHVNAPRAPSIDRFSILSPLPNDQGGTPGA